MEVKETITLINKENEQPVREYTIEDNALKLQDNVVISIHNYDFS